MSGYREGQEVMVPPVGVEPTRFVESGVTDRLGNRPAVVGTQAVSHKPPPFPEPADVPPYLPDGSRNPAWPRSYRDIAAAAEWLRYRLLLRLEAIE